MKSIILNSGTGKRMGILTLKSPKCLIKLIKDESILERQLRILQRNDIKDLIITTGPFENQIKDAIQQTSPKLNIQFVNNPLYSSTNYIYSLYLIPKRLIDDEIIILHGDMVFDEKLLIRLLDSDEINTVLVENTTKLPKKDFKGRIINGIITEIGVNTFGKNCFPLMPFYRYSQQSFLIWMNEIEKFIQNGHTSIYAEDAFNKIYDKINLKPIFFTEKELCMEIDNEADLLHARTRLIQRD